MLTVRPRLLEAVAPDHGHSRMQDPASHIAALRLLPRNKACCEQACESAACRCGCSPLSRPDPWRWSFFLLLLYVSSLRDSMALVALLLFLLLRLRRGRALPHRECLRHRRRRRGGSLLPQQQKLRCGYVIVEVQEYVWCLFRFRLGATLQFAWVFTAVRTGVQ
ncbi:uncharacterized protein LOC119340323 isoform X1 [Triticum dicoccoides]|uniref:uncharacterized protein LOC119340323 isoform X1 n=1 Tax=Triticum dicoccoides TaxID=85692 RepID=UPI0018916C04|nr:uncharacterized protein LOC119340323 isoform X1 [Triticum dicoccoides]